MSFERVKERENLYRSIIGQLLYDGLEVPALFLGNCVGMEVNRIPPSPQLLLALKNRKRYQEEKNKPQYNDSNYVEFLETSKNLTHGLNIDSEVDVFASSPNIGEYETQWATAHKGPCTVCAFSNDGKLLATGSEDTSIKIIDVERIFIKMQDSKSERNNTQTSQNEDLSSSKNHPVIRTLYDHVAPVSVLEFHPGNIFLASGGFDCTINFFDFSKSSTRKAIRSFNEVDTINSISFHPSGCYMLVAIEHPVVRLYDVETQSCFVSSNPYDQHMASVNTVKYEATGRIYATSSNDGSFKIWDGVSNRCVNTFKAAHSNFEILSATFSNNGKFLLTASVDRSLRLWDIRTGGVIQHYDGATNSNPGRVQAQFSQNEDYVIYLDETNSHGCWNSRTGDKVYSLPVGGSGVIRDVRHSPIEPSMASCCDDNRIRFWYSGQTHS